MTASAPATLPVEAGQHGARSGMRTLVAVMRIVVVMALLTGAALAIGSAYWISTLTSAFCLALACAGVAVLYGQLGLVSLCQYSLLGIGGWVALRLSFATGLPFELDLVGAGLVSMTVGVLWGLPALRLRGLYLALVTLMLAGAFQVVISAWGFPDGGDGFLGRADATERLMMARPSIATSNTAYLIYTAAVLTLGLVAIELHRRSKPGRAWALIRRGETTALSAGVNLVLYKAWAFALAGFLAGVAGGLLAGSVGQLDGRAFPASESMTLFALSVVGGVYSWFGSVIAGLLLRAVPALLTDHGIDGYVGLIIFGGALLHALVTAPSGIAGQIQALAGRIVGRRTEGGTGR